MSVISEAFVAGVELGGTKSVAVLARGDEIVARARCATTTPDETLGFLHGHLQQWCADQRVTALGIASFGPIRVDPQAADYGTMLTTPKRGWSNAHVAATLTDGLDCPWLIDTDVNAAALAEWRWGAGRGHAVVCYMTIGTGIGVGILIDGKPLHGTLHPEIGHLRLRRAEGDRFAGACSFHGDCIEGLLSGPALAARFGGPTEQIGDDDPRWSAVASDYGELLASLALTLSPHKIIIGGGVGMRRVALLHAAQSLLVDRLAGYLPDLSPASVRSMIVQPALGDEAGPRGSIALAQLASLQATSS
jgi:fructokinase